MIITHNFGYPRIGLNRELKFALEGYWVDPGKRNYLLNTAKKIRNENLNLQLDSGIDYAPSCDFSLYDTTLDHAIAFGLLPKRLSMLSIKDPLTNYFLLARGKSPEVNDEIAAGEMSKWFDTNYHYIVPEIGTFTKLELNSEILFSQVREARLSGASTKPTIIGPLTLLWMAKSSDPDFDKLSLLPSLLELYAEFLKRIYSLGIEWVQLDEPILCLDLPPSWLKAYESYEVKFNQLDQLNIMLCTYFEGLNENLSAISRTGASAVHIDLINGNYSAAKIDKALPKSMDLSLGIIDGRNVWITDYDKTINLVTPYTKLQRKIWIAPSCSLLHVPQDLELENKVKKPVRSWLSFARQKLNELEVIRTGLIEGRARIKEKIKENKALLKLRENSSLVHNKAVASRISKITPSWSKRKTTYNKRIKLQQDLLNLPLFPTTTIGSFPQTNEIRKMRMKYRAGKITKSKYNEFLKKQIKKNIKLQEKIGIDVAVHGEAERNDMVEYFGQQLNGFAFTENGWVQSYGSRCVKPPIIYGDVSRQKEMTVELTKYAASLTKLPVKGMLTGPVTILCWSFVRGDTSKMAICKQIAIALRDEVLDLERAGIKIIQIDEPALREGLPLKKANWKKYLRWAINCFRISTSGVKDATQIHTHMCYAEFNDIMDSIIKLDADVITIETSRSHMELLEAFRELKYPNSIGPGIYDIHSPTIPKKTDMIKLLENAGKLIPKESLWVNPDCGLKTRKIEEVIPALQMMVAAAKTLRSNYSNSKSRI